MSKVFFISEQLLKSSTNINDNVDSGALRSAIMTAQDINLAETLGTKLYKKLQTLVNTGDISLSGNTNYKTLMDEYIQPMVIQYSYFYALDAFIMKFVQAGLVQGSSEQGSVVDINTFKLMKSNAKNTAEFYDNRLRHYLCDSEHLYPEYTTSQDDGGLSPSNKNGITSSIVFGGRYYKNYMYNKKY